ncbi:phosphotransferase [Actinocorallia sp. A-T 12471]|uniref:phosphotransferase n=1 Tax=Actinocorallia sp. A-T 12471 TaxID=3089813 RepID=UPI0029D234AE|nr:phosphotransferase [Actinocorallia sp. A-T 12471]MDX6744770.1 phosphotransferase [Actinocorallia sp. A-T 12471]
MTPPAATAADLTPDYLTRALGLEGRAVVSVGAAPIGTGQVSQTLRLTLAYDRPGGGPRTLIAKIPSPDPASRSAAKLIRTYEVEAGFYSTLAPRLPAASVPACHFAAHDPETDDYTVLLEDFASARPGDQLSGLTTAEAASAVKEMAVLHAAVWEDPFLEGLTWLNRDDADSRSFTAALVTSMYEGFRERYADRIPADGLALIEEFLPSLEKYLAPYDAPSSLVHGDFRADNLLFGPPRPAILDWQTCSRGAAVADLAYFLSSSLPTPVRRAEEESLVRLYHATLAAEGVDYPWEACWTAYRRHAFTGVVMAIGASMLVERTARGDDMFCTMTARHAAHAADLDALSLLP